MSTLVGSPSHRHPQSSFRENWVTSHRAYREGQLPPTPICRGDKTDFKGPFPLLPLNPPLRERPGHALTETVPERSLESTVMGSGQGRIPVIQILRLWTKFGNEELGETLAGWAQSRLAG